MKTKNLIILVTLILAFYGCVYLNEESEYSETIAYQIKINDKWQVKTCKNTSQNSLPLNLVIRPGKYSLDSLKYDLSKEGLVRIMELGRKNTQRLVFEDDTISLLSGLCWIVTHGNRDNNKNFEELNALALTQKLYLTCGSASNWVVKILENLDIQSREVMILTLDQWNNYDNGHNMVEVLTGGEWILFDIDNNMIFRKNDKLVNLLQFQRGIKNDSIEMILLSNDLRYQSEWQDKYGYDLSFFSESIFAGEHALSDRYRKISDVIFIENNDTMFFCENPDHNLNERILSYSSRIKAITENDFYHKFYNTK